MAAAGHVSRRACAQTTELGARPRGRGRSAPGLGPAPQGRVGRARPLAVSLRAGREVRPGEHPRASRGDVARGRARGCAGPGVLSPSRRPAGPPRRDGKCRRAGSVCGRPPTERELSSQGSAGRGRRVGSTGGHREGVGKVARSSGRPPRETRGLGPPVRPKAACPCALSPSPACGQVSALKARRGADVPVARRPPPDGQSRARGDEGRARHGSASACRSRPCSTQSELDVALWSQTCARSPDADPVLRFRA